MSSPESVGRLALLAAGALLGTLLPAAASASAATPGVDPCAQFPGGCPSFVPPPVSSGSAGVLGEPRAGYFRHLSTEQARAERQGEEKRTVSEIRAIHTEHHGAPRVHAELRAGDG